jgi:ankyrin repeat protein
MSIDATPNGQSKDANSLQRQSLAVEMFCMPADRGVAERLKTALERYDVVVKVTHSAETQKDGPLLVETNTDKAKAARLILCGADAYSADPCLGKWAPTYNEERNIFEKGREPLPVIVRLTDRELPEFLLPAAGPWHETDIGDGRSELLWSRVVDYWRHADAAPELVAAALKLASISEGLEVAQDLLVQSLWLPRQILQRIMKGPVVLSPAELRLVDVTLPENVPELVQAVLARDLDALLPLLRVGGRELATQSVGSGLTILLLAAAVPGNGAIVAALISNGANVRLRGSYGHSPLLSAAWAKDKESVDHLLAAGDDGRAVSLRGQTPLAAVAWLGDAGIAETLLKAGANPVITDDNMGHALIWAAQAGHLSIVEMILAQHPNSVNTPAGAYGFGSKDPEFSPNTQAIPPLIRLHRQDKILKAHLGRTALLAAIQKDHIEIVEILLNLGAMAGPSTITGVALGALHMSVGLGNQRIAALLLDRGADPNAIDGFGLTPLLHAVINASHETIDLLIKRGNWPG